MIKCSECILQKKAKNCRACRNLVGKLYLDFMTETEDLIFGPKNNNERVYAVQDSVKLEKEMIMEFKPSNLKERFKICQST